MTTARQDIAATARPIVGTANAVDAAAGQPVLVIGSTPPDGRDLDLVARRADHDAIAQQLTEIGHVQRRSSWVRLDPAGVSAVELFAADSLRLPGDTEELFRGALPLPGYAKLVRPAPAVVLLLTARGLIVRRGVLTDKARRRVQRAISEDDEAWRHAAHAAPKLGLSGALTVLRRAVAGGAPESLPQRLRLLLGLSAAPDSLSAKATLLRAAFPRRIWPTIVSLSGPHGTGKSTQVELLRSTLIDLGVTTEKDRAPVPPTRIPRFVRRLTGRLRSDQSETVPGHAPLAPVNQNARGSALARVLAHIWCCQGAISFAFRMWQQALHPRRAQVLVLDRFTLDASVSLAYWFGHRHRIDVRTEQSLFKLLTPRPKVSIVMLAQAETLYSRRAEEYTLDGFRLLREFYLEAGKRYDAILVDADRPADVIARDVATLVWSRLP
jgi:thymidylate kinase